MTNYSNNLRKKLAEFNSGYKRIKLINNEVVLPKEYSIGTRREQRYDKELQTFREINIPITLAYIPILETLKFLYKDKCFRSYVENYTKNNNKDLIDIDDTYIL